MDKFMKLSAVVVLIATVATAIGVVLTWTGVADATIWSVSFATVLIAAGASYFLPSFIRYVRWRRQAAEAGIVINDWVQPTNKDHRRAAVQEPLLYVTVMDICDVRAISARVAANVVFPMLQGFNMKELTGQYLYHTVVVLTNAFRYPAWKSTEEGRELTGRLVSQMEKVGVPTAVAYMDAFELDDALNAMESELSLEYARSIFARRRTAYTGA